MKNFLNVLSLVFALTVSSLGTSLLMTGSAFAGLNLNTATQAELEALPGVGGKIAGDIVKARPFKSVDDLKNVKGIGNAKFDKLKAMVEVEGAAPAVAAAPQTAPKAVDATKNKADAVQAEGAKTVSSTAASAGAASGKAGSKLAALGLTKVNLNTACIRARIYHYIDAVIFHCSIQILLYYIA